MDTSVRDYAFEVVGRSSETAARLGRLHTPHSVIETPVFMPVGTQGTVKAMSQQEMADMGYKIVLGNTYHLYLRPARTRFAIAGGLHKFMNWCGAILRTAAASRFSV